MVFQTESHRFTLGLRTVPHSPDQPRMVLLFLPAILSEALIWISIIYIYIHNLYLYDIYIYIHMIYTQIYIDNRLDNMRYGLVAYNEPQVEYGRYF